MSTPFAVTSPSNTILLRASRQGEAPFTVSNVSGRPLRGRALLFSENPSTLPWLSIQGGAERDFPIAGTEQFAVRIAVPADAPAGNYVFRLDAVGVENPDELFSQGPTVTFQVPATQAPPKRFPWWIPAIVGAVIVAAVLAFVLWPRSVAIPPLRGLPLIEATGRIREAGLQLGRADEVEDSEVALGQVVRSDPAAGTKVKRGSSVVVAVSKGPRPTPTPAPTPTPTMPPVDALAILSPDWPMGSHDAARTSHNAVERRLMPPLRKLWESSPGLSGDRLTVSAGRMAVAGQGAGGNQVSLLDAASGQRAWDFALTGGGRGAMSLSPTFGEGRVLFGGQGDDKLYAVDVATGALGWEASGLSSGTGQGLYGSQIAAVNGLVYVPDVEQGIVAFRLRDGKAVWGTVARAARGRPLTLRNEMAFTVWGSDLVAFDTDTRQEVWRFGGANAAFPWVIAGEQNLYARLSGNKIVALSMTGGALRWSSTINASQIGEGLWGALADGIIYLPVWADNQGKGAVVALDAANGGVRWTFAANTQGMLRVAVANRVVYALGYGDGTVYALSPANGQVLWSAPVGSGPQDLAIADGKLLVLTSGGVIAFGN